ncbi:HIT family protein [Streptodolium elevatio]|uniref:HIT domain-containing protein n=1 Tax=Streptodolium elevatio TaxID=3157996 RepID=A0ABV3DGU4_9ACTN
MSVASLTAGVAWPSDWAERRAGRGCAMCGNDGAEDIGVAVLVGRGKYVDAYAKRSRVRGYVMAIWNGRHVAEPTELKPVEVAGYWTEVTEVGRIVEDAFDVWKVNYETLGNALPHLHTHVIPRHQEDPAPGGPMPGEWLDAPPRSGDEFSADLAQLRWAWEQRLG